MTQTLPETTAVANWYGSNRMLAATVGAELAGCKWVGIPFAGGMCEVAHIAARTLQVNDLHRHVINLARVVADPLKRPELIHRVKRLPFHPEVLEEAQGRCLAREFDDGNPDTLFMAAAKGPSVFDNTADVVWAADYFASSWMGRGGMSGTKGEFKGGLSLRWDAGGGGSNTRYRSAVRSLATWGRLMRRCDFTTLDASIFLGKCQDTADTGIYADPPFPGPGDLYRFPGTEGQQRTWAKDLGRFKSARVVIRYYDHPLVRELYPDDRWTWVRRDGRDRNNDGNKPEVLIINGPSLAAAGAEGGGK